VETAYEAAAFSFTASQCENVALIKPGRRVCGFQQPARVLAGSRASGRLSAREPVAEPLYVQSPAAEQPGLDFRGVCGVVFVEEVAEIEGARSGGRFPLQRPEPFPLR
jgi:hypothetical protein